MSEYIFKLPDLGEGTVESEIAEWHVAVGDEVTEEQIVGTMMTDKAAVEISAPVSGKVKKLAGEPGDIVPVGAALIVFETNAAAAADDATDAAAQQEQQDQREQREKAPARQTSAGKAAAAQQATAAGATRGGPLRSPVSAIAPLAAQAQAGCSSLPPDVEIEARPMLDSSARR